MNKALSDHQVSQFHEQGFLAGLRVWDDRVVEQAQSHFRQVTADLESHGLTHNDVNGWWALNRTYWNLCAIPEILDCLEDLLGADLFIFGGQYFLKNPGDGTTVPWHQDIQYWSLTRGTLTVSAWIALWDTDASNGCMQVIPGSHKTLLEHGAGTRSTDVLDLAVRPEDIDDRQAVDINLRAGEMSIHADALVHGSHANDSDRMRCGMTMRIGTPDVSVDLAEWPLFHWIRLRGNDSRNNNPTLEPPREDRVPTGYNQFGQEE